MENKVKVLKLVTGEEVITTIIEEWPQIRLNRPMIIQPIEEDRPFGGGMSKGTGVSMIMMPWSFIGDGENVVINNDHILAILEALPETVEEYNNHLKESVKKEEPILQSTLGGGGGGYPGEWHHN